MADNKIEVFICYAHQDESLMRELEHQLSTLEQQELITIWHDRMIAGGADWKQEIDKHLNAARVILLLVSANFMASKYSQVEVKRAMERHDAGEAQVIPVILKYVSWKGSSFGKLTPFPKDGKPVTSSAWHSHDEALFEVVEGVEKAAEELRKPLVPIAKPSSSNATQSSSNKEQQPMTQNAKDEEFDVFLCHNSQDKPQIKEIARQLQARGLKPWLDDWQLRPGFPWQRALEEQIEQIKSAAVFVGKNGQGPWQTMELEAFIHEFVDRECPVIPVLLANAPEKPRLPAFLRGMTWVDFRKPETEPLERLIWGITGKNPNDLPSDGAEASGRSSASPTVNPAPVSTVASKASGNPGPLTFQQKTELVSKLLACPTMRDGNARNMVVQELSFAGAIPRHAGDRVDVMNIVNTSLNFQDGLQELVEIVSSFERDASGNESLPMKQLRAFVDSLS